MSMEAWEPKRIEELRKVYKLTRKELAELTGVTITTIYLWEMGTRKPSRTAQILLSKIEQELKGKRPASKQARKEVKKHGKRTL